MYIKKVDGKITMEINVKQLILMQYALLEYKHLLNQSYRNPKDRTPITESCQKNIDVLHEMHQDVCDILKEVWT